MRRPRAGLGRRRAGTITEIGGLLAPVRRAAVLLAAGAIAVAPSSAASGATKTSASAGTATARAAAARGHIQVIHLHRLGRENSVWVYRPNVPESAKLPVLYFLHGLPGQPQDLFRYAGLVQVVDSYIAQGGTPLVIAAPDGNSPRHADTEWGNASDGSDNLESFILHRVVPAVEGRHRRDAAHRAIAGFSMGGFGAMNIILRNPGMFGQVATLCGYFHLDDPSGMFATPESQRDNDPDLSVNAARGHRILLMDSLKDGESLTNRQSQSFKSLLDEARIPARLVLAPGTHSWAYVRSQIPRMLSFFAGGWGHSS